jgi:sulfite exporter TauE/SafE
MINPPAVLCLVAGVLLFREGLLASGLMRRHIGGTATTACLFRPLFGTLLKTPGGRNAFVAGIATGLLPCGLVYAFVSLAASSGELAHGLATMLAFGIGTIPLMVITGCGASLLSWAARRRLWKIAAWSVMLTGLMTVGRGIAFLRATSEEKAAACPYCATHSAEAPQSFSSRPDR